MTCHDTKIYLIFNPPLNFSPRTICNTNDARTVKLFHPFRRNRQTSRHIHTPNLTIINQVYMSKSRARFWVICMRRLIDKHNSLLFPDPGLTDVVPRVEKLIVTLQFCYTKGCILNEHENVTSCIVKGFNSEKLRSLCSTDYLQAFANFSQLK